jgi:hypothetical protein
MMTRERGLVMVLALFLLALLAVVTMLLLTDAQFVASDTRNTEVKNESFDAAEAGINAALDALDVSLAAIPTGSATLPSGYRYAYTVYPNFGGLAALSWADPNAGGQLTIPIGSAVIVSTGKGPVGERPTTVEALVTADVVTQSYPNLAIVAGRNIQGNYNPNAGIKDDSNQNSANVHANGLITARIGGGIQGVATASGKTNTLPPGTTGAPLVLLPTISQFDYVVSNYDNQAKLFASAYTVDVPAGGTLQPSYLCPASAPAGGCLVFYDGPLTSTSGQTTFSGPWTLVINGDYKQAGSSQMIFQNQPSMLIVNGNADFGGNAVAGAYVQVKGSLSLGGNGAFSGAIMALGNVTFDGGGVSGGFTFNPKVIPPPTKLIGLVKIVTYGEY